MKPLINILLMVLFVSFPGIITGGTTEERRRAATVSALRHHEFPPQLLRLIASNGHVSRDCEQLEMGFFPQNEWKALERVFKRNERTAAIRHVIGQYDDAHAAWENSPESDERDCDGKVSWSVNRFEMHALRSWNDEREHGLCITIRSETGLSFEITLNADHEIITLLFLTMNEKDICDLSSLSSNLRGLMIHNGNQTNFEFSKLPKGLKWLTHPGPDAKSTLHVQSLPPELDTLQLRRYGRTRKEDPLKVHFNLPLPQGLKLRVPRMDGFVFHPEPAQMDKIDGERSWETIWEVKWDDGSQIQVIIES